MCEERRVGVVLGRRVGGRLLVVGSWEEVRRVEAEVYG